MQWAYGITSCRERVENGLLQKTLSSLAFGCFEKPRIFLDDCGHFPPLLGPYEVTLRGRKVNPFNNWILALLELWCCNPKADRWAIFQDDLVTYRNLRKYLEVCPYPINGYLNLYTFPSNSSICPVDHKGWYLSNQYGRGAVALIFDREAVTKLLCDYELVTHPASAAHPERKIDGVVVEAMSRAGIREYVHNPSLVQHTGAVSTAGSNPQLLSDCFMGEDYDATELIKCTKPAPNYQPLATISKPLSRQSNSLVQNALRRGSENPAVAKSDKPSSTN